MQGYRRDASIARSILLFVLAALAEIGGAWLVWQGWCEHRGLWWIAAGIIALGAYGFVAREIEAERRHRAQCADRSVSR